MRACLAIALIVAAAVSAYAQSDGSTPPSSRSIHANMETAIATAPFSDKMKFEEFLRLLGKQLPPGREVTFAIDLEAYLEAAADAPDIREIEVRIRMLSAKTSAWNLLRQAVKQLPPSALIVRAGRIDIVPAERASKEYMLNQMVNVDFKNRPLDAALEELSELTGVSIVVDGRAKAKTAVSARFRNDVSLQDAVRMLTEMADLKVVYFVTGLYVTSPERALVMQKELKQIYDAPPSMPVSPGAGIVGGSGMVGGGPPPDPTVAPSDPPQSPLAPPLPPRLRSRKNEAA